MLSKKPRKYYAKDLNRLIKKSEHKKILDTNDISDGAHTFGELYEHRMYLFALFVNSHRDISWKSYLHSDGTSFDDYFIVGINTPEGQYSYHYKNEFWDLFNVKILDKAPEYDGHKPSDIKRLFSVED